MWTQSGALVSAAMALFAVVHHRKIDEIDPRGLVGTSEALEAVLELGMG